MMLESQKSQQEEKRERGKDKWRQDGKFKTRQAEKSTRLEKTTNIEIFVYSIEGQMAGEGHLVVGINSHASEFHQRVRIRGRFTGSLHDNLLNLAHSGWITRTSMQTTLSGMRKGDWKRPFPCPTSDDCWRDEKWRSYFVWSTDSLIIVGNFHQVLCCDAHHAWLGSEGIPGFICDSVVLFSCILNFLFLDFNFFVSYVL